MNRYRIRIFLTESQWVDTVVTAASWSMAQSLGQGQSPLGRAIYLGEAL